MRQRLGIAIALVGNPSFLVLDEPINGLDPQGIIEMRQLLLNLNQQYGITILVSSHILDELSRLATHYGFIDNGKMIKEISADDAFCKKVLRNEARDYQNALARKRNREVYFSELPVEVLEQFAVRDTYFTDSRTFEVIGHSVCIDDETLAEAISALPVDRRDIILLSYFLDMSDAEIANVLNMVRRSVAYRRTSTLKLLKNLMGGENR